MHPSPLASAFLAPFAQFPANDFDVIALDAPGYRDSDPPAQPEDTLKPDVEVLGEILG
ncbi:hypothetical protein [Halioglobus japonicus]|uniref:hypothetical protein n=1 Tax=Halioglobus japonicus TaxID=930805 RepID=UPI0012F5025F|nr:hypothetical protein [Halioglobus japonicus]